jgi:hypothetical protein
MGTARALACLAASVALAACGGRSGLLDGSSRGAADARVDTASSRCPPFPPIPKPPAAPLGAACTFSPSASSSAPVLAAIAGEELIALTPRATITTLFRFSTPAASVAHRSVVSRGELLGALIVTMPSTSSLGVELVLVRLDGAVIAHHQETLAAVQNFGGAYGVIGNAGGTFAFGVGKGKTGKVWVALPSKTVLGPFDGDTLPLGMFSARVDPDARGRFLVLPVGGSSAAQVSWLDPCFGTRTAARLPASGAAVAWGHELFGITASGQLSVETADGVTPLAHPSLGAQARLWHFVPSGVAMVAVPPFPPKLTATGINLRIVNASTLVAHDISLAYPGGLSVVPPDAWISPVGDSNNPAGFGLTSSGQVTMFLSDGSGAIRLRVTSKGSDWTAVGPTVTYDPTFAPSYSLRVAEAGGTYVIKGIAGGKSWRVVRPASGVEVALQGPGQIAGDGGCVSALASATQLEVVNAASGKLTTIPLPSAVIQNAWVSTWIPGDDATLSP